MQRVKLDTITPFTPRFVKDRVSIKSNATQLYASRVQGRQILLENPARVSRTKQERHERKTKRIAQKVHNDGAHPNVRLQRLWKLKKEETKWDRRFPIHSLLKANLHSQLQFIFAPTLVVAWVYVGASCSASSYIARWFYNGAEYRKHTR